MTFALVAFNTGTLPALAAVVEVSHLATEGATATRLRHIKEIRNTQSAAAQNERADCFRLR